MLYTESAGQQEMIHLWLSFWASQVTQWERIHLQCRRHWRCGFDLWVRKIPWVGSDNSLQYFCMENSMDRGAWQATVHGVPKILTQFRDWVPLLLSCQGRERRGRLVFNSSVSSWETVDLSSKTRSFSSSKSPAVSPWTTFLPMAHQPFSSCSDENLK